MKKSRYNDGQIVRILREAGKAPIAEVAKRHGVSEQSIYSWRKRFGEMNADDVKNRLWAEQGFRRWRAGVVQPLTEADCPKTLPAHCR